MAVPSGIIEELTSAVKIMLSPAAEPNVIFPLDPASNVTLPTACRFPPTQTSEDALNIPETPKLPVMYLFAILPVKFKFALPSVCVLYKM